MKSKYDFNDVVKINSEKKELKEINNCLAIVCGKAEDEIDPTIFYYAVSVLDNSGKRGLVWSVGEADLESTGNKAESINPVGVIRVKVDPETGEGKIIED